MLKKPIINTLVQVVGKIVTVLLSLVTTGILTRKLGVSLYGNYMLITSVFLLFDSLADFGTKVIGVRESCQEIGEKRKYIYIQIAWFRLFTSLLAFLGGLLLIIFWSGFATVKLEALVALSMISFTVMAGSLEVIFQTEMRMGLKVLMDILFPLTFVATLLLWNGKITLLWIFGVYLGARILSLSLGWNLIKKIIGKIKIKIWDKKFIMSFFKQTWPMGIYMILFSGYDRAVDSILIKQFIGAEKLAFYGLAYKIYGNLIQPAYFFVNSIFPIMSARDTNKKSLFVKSTWLMLLGILLVAPTIYWLSPWIINILAGNEFGESVIILRILLIAMVFAYISHLVGFTLIAKGGQKQILIIGLVSLIINIIGNLIAIPRFGIEGAAGVTVLTEGVASVLMIMTLKKT
ncbi:MAG: oligosaccharide flippase family protein [Candidatus Shapirobacteria bacterium]|jgi:O-antigen/teichoic acid export membrane protein